MWGHSLAGGIWHVTEHYATGAVSLGELLDRYVPRDEGEAADVARVRSLVASPDPWSRSTPLHVTGSALIVHPASRRVLLRWHQRQRAWLQVGGHADPGETDPLAVALREGVEETGLVDLVPWPTPDVLHVTVVPVRAAGAEAAHEHADIRFMLATAFPDIARPEKPGAVLRWLTIQDAHQATNEDNLRESLSRVEARLSR
jgi:8-oxo-dGTP pyrophosphatase MutT (NUDIX family)